MTTSRNIPETIPVAPPQRHATLVGIDSDGCVFDTMDIKQRRHFHPAIVRWWKLEPIERLVRETAERVNLRSACRGRNRFLNLLELFERLERHPEIRDRGISLPPLDSLRAYCNSGMALGNDSLAARGKATGDPELRRLLAWSRAVDDDIAANMAPVPPFDWARRALRKMSRDSDLVVISQTPAAVLRREWRHHAIDRLVNAIAGQEQGDKHHQLTHANSGRYPDDRVLMIGDAPGDLDAARACGAGFYPILAGREEASWQRLHNEAYPLFLEGRYRGPYAESLLREFLAPPAREPG